MQRRNRPLNEAWASSSLDPTGCLTLHQIVGSFSAPIGEEQAWAIIYESVRTLDLCLSNSSLASKSYMANSLDHVRVHEDGHVHENSFILASGELNNFRAKKCSFHCSFGTLIAVLVRQIKLHFSLS